MKKIFTLSCLLILTFSVGYRSFAQVLDADFKKEVIDSKICSDQTISKVKEMLKNVDLGCTIFLGQGTILTS